VTQTKLLKINNSNKMIWTQDLQTLPTVPQWSIFVDTQSWYAHM